jgi:hypothetical protein
MVLCCPQNSSFWGRTTLTDSCFDLLACRVVKKGLLLFAKSVLNFPLAGTLRLGHVMVIVTGMALVGE